MADLLKNPKLCGACNAPGCKLKCACKLVFYCGAECQGKDWPRHKKECVKSQARKIKEARREHGKDDVAVAQARCEAGNTLRSQGRYREAERCYLDARGIYEEVGGESSADRGTGEISRNLGGLYHEMGSTTRP